MVQEPETAKYDGMPRSAIETGLVDFIVPVEKMPETLIKYVKHPFIESLDKTNLKEPPVKHQIQKIFALIRTKTGHDFIITSRAPLPGGLNAAWRSTR